jgi:hypothetical protein
VPVAQMLTGAYLGKKGDEESLKIAEQLKANEAKDITSFYEDLYGNPNKMVQQAGPTPEGGNLPIENVSVPPNPQAAYQRAAKSQSSLLRQQLAELLKGQKLAEGEVMTRFNPVTGKMEEVGKGGQKYHAPTSVDMGTLGTMLIYPDGRREMVQKGREGPVGNPQEAGLRSSFFNQAQPHIAISQAYRKIDSAPETAAGDMSRIFGYMKILDPSSTVREGEYASAENARGVPSSIQAQYNKVLNGQRLTPQQRTEFTQSAGDIVNSQKQQFESQKKYYSDVASHYKIAPQNIIYDPYADLSIRTTPPKTPKGQVNPAQQLNIPQAGGGNAGWNIIGVTPTNK